MSFILDALRKSESERQRNQRPGMVNMQVQKPRRGSGIWLPLVALLVGINLSLLLVMWIMGERDEPATSSTEASSPGAVSEAIRPDAVSPRSEQRLSEEVGAVQNDAAVPDVEVPEEPAANVYTANTNDEYDSLPTVDELVLQNAITVPPLRLDIHVYSDDPSERFVFINMSRYDEGSTLSEGPKLIAITQTGIVLRFQGQEFLITRE